MESENILNRFLCVCVHSLEILLPLWIYLSFDKKLIETFYSFSNTCFPWPLCCSTFFLLHIHSCSKKILRLLIKNMFIWNWKLNSILPIWIGFGLSTKFYEEWNSYTEMFKITTTVESEPQVWLWTSWRSEKKRSVSRSSFFQT